MQLGTYLYLLLGVSAFFWLIGYAPAVATIGDTNPYESFTENVGVNQTIGQTVINNIGDIFTSPQFLALIGITAITSFIVGGGGFSVVFIFPVLLLVTVFVNLFVFPSSIFFDPNLPFFFRTFIAAFFNLSLAIAIVNFIKGGPA